MEQEFYNQNTIIVKRFMNKIEQLSQGDLSNPALIKQITQLANLASKISRIKIPAPIKPVAEARAAATKANNKAASSSVNQTLNGPISSGIATSDNVLLANPALEVSSKNAASIGSAKSTDNPSSTGMTPSIEQSAPRNRAERRRMEQELRKKLK